MLSRVFRRRPVGTRLQTTVPEPDQDSWWPWSPSPSGAVCCSGSAVVFNALQRRITATGALRSCCAVKVGRVRDFALTCTPGDTSIDLTGVTVLEPSVAVAILTWRRQLADHDLRLAIVGASPTVVRALEI